MSGGPQIVPAVEVGSLPAGAQTPRPSDLLRGRSRRAAAPTSRAGRYQTTCR
jgi:hypothetical protein